MSERVGKVLFWAWMTLFVLGAAGELLGLGWLSEWTDVKRLFLR